MIENVETLPFLCLVLWRRMFFNDYVLNLLTRLPDHKYRPDQPHNAYLPPSAYALCIMQNYCSRRAQFMKRDATGS